MQSVSLNTHSFLISEGDVLTEEHFVSYLLGVSFMPETDQYLPFFFLARLPPEQFNAVVVSLFPRLGRACVTADLSAYSSP